MLSISWDLFQGGSFAEAKVDVKEQIDKRFEYSQCVVSDEPDVFFQQFDLEQQIVPQTFTHRCLKYSHRVGVLTEEDIATVVDWWEIFKCEENKYGQRCDLIRSVLKTALKQSTTGARIVGQQSKNKSRFAI